LGYGLDFGYSNDPTAIVSLTKEDDDIYVEELLFEKGLTNDDIAARLRALGVDKSDPIYCDSAEPKSIQELCNHGFNAKPAKKGRDSINYGINLIKQFNFNVIEPSYNLIKELKHYKWIEDKDGKTLNKPVDAYNHLLDATRYVCMETLKAKRSPLSLSEKKRQISNFKASLINSGVKV